MRVCGGEHTDKVIGPPNDLMLGNAAQLPKVFRGRWFRVPMDCLVLAGLALAPSHIAANIEAIGRIDNSQINGVFRHFPQRYHAVHVIGNVRGNCSFSVKYP